MRSAHVALFATLLAAGCTASPATPSSSAADTGTPVPSATSTDAASPSLSPDDARTLGWRMDLDRLITAREDVHPDPWHGIPRQEYVDAVEAVAARVPELTDDELLVEITRLAAMPTWAGRDGHGGIYPWGEGSYGVHMYPLRLYWFSDGVFVVDALAPYQDRVGARVAAIGGHPTEEVLAAVEPLVPRDNHQQVLTHSPRLIVAAEILHGLGFIDDPTEPVAFTFEADGEQVVADVAPTTVERFEEWAGGYHTHSPPARPQGATWLRRPREPIWWERQAETGTLYVQYNFVAGGVPSVADELATTLAAGGVERVVIDARLNPGGNNTTYGPLLRFVRDAAVAMPGRVYVIMGRATFSAAGNFVTEVEQSTDAILVGEDLGGSPNQYGDSLPAQLEHSRLILRVAPEYITMSARDDPRITISPDIPAPLSSVDYFADRDPAMDAILAHEG